MKRREFLTKAGASGLIATGALGMSSTTSAKIKYKWKMVTTWPKNFPEWTRERPLRLFRCSLF